jgi:hypothetical protein
MSCGVQVTRHVYDQSAGKTVPQSEVLEVPIKPGWKAGTKITYAGVQRAVCAGPHADIVQQQQQQQQEQQHQQMRWWLWLRMRLHSSCPLQ